MWFCMNKLDSKNIFAQGTNIPQPASAEKSPLMILKKNSPLKTRTSLSDELHVFIMLLSLKLYRLSTRGSKVI